jgi:hypothetical protein
MTKAEELFHEIAASLPDTKESKMFGALCVKTPNGKAGVMFWHEHMVFKLPAKDMEVVLSLKGAKIFEPMAGRQMNGWVQVPFAHQGKWRGYAERATEYVRAIKGK